MTLALERGSDPLNREPARWGLCFAIVAALHVLPLMVLILWARPAPLTPAAPPPPAVMVDMAPLPLPSPTPPQPLSRPQPQPVPTSQPPRAITLPQLPPVATAAAVAPTPPETPTPARTAPLQPAPPSRPAAPAPPATTAAAPSVSKATATWQGQLLGRLEKFKRYPQEAQFHRQQGVVYLRFTINRDGRVLSARIDKASGYDLLDAEALALVQRAQPLPKPPPEVQGETIELVTPIEFFMGGRR